MKLNYFFIFVIAIIFGALLVKTFRKKETLLPLSSDLLMVNEVQNNIPMSQVPNYKKGIKLFQDKSDATYRKNLRLETSSNVGLPVSQNDTQSLLNNEAKSGSSHSSFNFVGSLIVNNPDESKKRISTRIIDEWDAAESLDKYPEVFERLKTVQRGKVRMSDPDRTMTIEVSIFDHKNAKIRITDDNGFVLGELRASGDFDDDIRISKSEAIIIDASGEGTEFLQIYLSQDNDSMNGFYYKLEKVSNKLKYWAVIRPT